MEKHILAFLVFCLGVCLSACQMGPTQINTGSKNIPQAVPREPSTPVNQNPGPAGAGFEQVGNTLTWFNEKGKEEITFLISTQPKNSPHFKTKSDNLIDFLQNITNQDYIGIGAYNNNNNNYISGISNNPYYAHFYGLDGTFLRLYYYYSSDLEENYPKSWHDNPKCKPVWKIFLNNRLLGEFPFGTGIDDYSIPYPEGTPINAILRFERTPMGCINEVERNQKIDKYIPVGTATYTLNMSACNNDYCPSLLQVVAGDLMCPPQKGVVLNKLIKNNLKIEKNINNVITETFENLDFTVTGEVEDKPQITRRQIFQKTIKQLNSVYHIQSGSPPSPTNSPEPTPEPSPTPSQEPTPIPSPTFLAEIPEVIPGEEHYMFLFDQTNAIRDIQDVWRNRLEDIIKENQRIKILYQDSTQASEQEKVIKAEERILRSQQLLTEILQLKTQLEILSQSLLGDCPFKAFKKRPKTSIESDEFYYKVPFKGVFPPFQITILDSYFQASETGLNPYKKELIILGRISNPIGWYFDSADSEGYSAAGQDSSALLRHMLIKSSVFENSYYPAWSEIQDGNSFGGRGSFDSMASIFKLTLKNYRFTPDFIHGRGIDLNDLMNKRLFQQVPVQLEAKVFNHKESASLRGHHCDSYEFICSYISPNTPFIHESLYPADMRVRSDVFVINPLGLEVLDIPENEEVVYLDGAALFSPRDQNVQFDRLAIPLDVPPGSGWNMKLLAQDDLDGEPFWQTSGTGPQQVVWDGFSEENCVPENKYVLRASDSQGNVISEQTLAVDSTPPLVKELDIQVNVLQTEPEEVVETTVKFQLFDPLIKGVAAGLNLDKWQLQIEVDDAPLFATPLRDPDGFWVASTLPQNQITVESVDPRTAKVEFKLPYRLDGRMVKVRARDRVGNQVWQLIQSQGGLF